MPTKLSPLEALGNRVVELRRERDLTQQDVAFRAGLSISAISKLETAMTPHPSITTLFRIAQGLDVTLSELVKGV